MAKGKPLIEEWAEEILAMLREDLGPGVHYDHRFDPHRDRLIRCRDKFLEGKPIEEQTKVYADFRSTMEPAWDRAGFEAMAKKLEGEFPKPDVFVFQVFLNGLVGVPLQYESLEKGSDGRGGGSAAIN